MTTSHPAGADAAPAADAVGVYERELAAYLRVREVIAVSSGTAAIHTALDAVGVGPGDEVLVPAVSVVMSAAPVRHLGARPVVVDCDPTGAGLDLADVEAKIGDRTRAVLPVPLWGRADPRAAQVHEVARRHGITVIVDACQALGSTAENGCQIGLDAAAACFSTHASKLLATGEGGFLATDDATLAARARAYRSHWLPPPAGQAPASRPAHNFRLAAPLAEIGRRELAHLDQHLAQRRDQTRLLTQLVAASPHLGPADCPDGWNAYAPLLHLTVPRPRAFCEHLAELGVPNSTGTFRLVPLDRRPAFADPGRPPCPNAAAHLDRVLALVLTRQDTPDRIRRYADTIVTEAARWAD